MTLLPAALLWNTDSRLSELKNHKNIELTIYHLEESNFAGPPV